MDAFELNAEIRTGKGRAESRRLRRQGRVPGVVYGGNREPALISLGHNELNRSLDNEAFFSHIIKIRVADGRSQQVVLRDLQRHPARPFIEHIDFMRVTADEKLRMSVPLHFVGEEECVGVRVNNGILQRALNEIEIECLPRDLPEYIEIDVTELDINEILHLSDLTVPEGVDIVELLYAEEGEEESPVVSVRLPRAEAEEDDEGEADEAEAAEEADGAEAEAADGDDDGDNAEG